MSKAPIIILSQPIRTGKTTALMNRINRVKDSDGVLSPDVSGVRKLLLIGKRHLIAFETSNPDDATAIGRFHFSNHAFETANDYLMGILPNENGEIIIDEIGKLELDGKGFYPSLMHHLNLVRKNYSRHHLILVVRDTLLEEVKATFGITDAQIISTADWENSDDFANQVTVRGLVLCAGNSIRMGTDKAFLKYRGIEQYQYLASLFFELHIPVVVSCNEMQHQIADTGLVTMIDDGIFKDNGPISGLLTAFKKYPEGAFILVGCDYPLVTKKHLQMLASLSSYGFEAVCFVRKNDLSVNEPLITFYDNSFKEKLLHSFEAGNSSIKKILDQSNTLKILVEDDTFLKSFDTPDDFYSFHQ